MKLSFSNLSIRIKVIILIAFISSITLIISSALFFLYDRSEFKSKNLRDLSILAEVIGNNNTAALTFGDKKAANESLNSLSAEKQIKHAVIFTKNGLKLAEYYSADHIALWNISKKTLDEDKGIDIKNIPEGGYKFYDNSLIIFKKVLLDKEVIGIVYLYSTLEEYTQRFNQFVSFLSLLLLYTILGIMVFSLILQRFISRPIINLSKIMNQVSEKRDYSLRIIKSSNDEVGKLCDGFNNMIAEIENQNKTQEKEQANKS